MVNLEEFTAKHVFLRSPHLKVKTGFRHTRYALFFLVFLPLSGFSAVSPPNITSLQLSKSPAELTSIKGNGFGRFEGKVLSWDDFDSHPTASSLQTHNALNGYSWFAKGESSANLDTRYAQSGNQSVKLDWPAGATARGYFGWSGREPLRQLYISYWHRMEGSINSPESRYQQLYLTSNAADKPPQLNLEIRGINPCWTIHTSFGQPQQSAANLPDHSNCRPLITGKFQRWELAINLPQSTASIWFDGAPIFNVSGAANPGSSGFTEVNLGYLASKLPEHASSWFDDVYIASSQARVEACNTPEYANCRRRHQQYVEPESWSDGEIKLRLHNLRMFRGEPIYLYVIDANGQVSNSIAIARPVMKAN